MEVKVEVEEGEEGEEEWAAAAVYVDEAVSTTRTADIRVDRRGIKTRKRGRVGRRIAGYGVGLISECGDDKGKRRDRGLVSRDECRMFDGHCQIISTNKNEDTKLHQFDAFPRIPTHTIFVS